MSYYNMPNYSPYNYMNYPYQPVQQQQQVSGLNGKIVDSADVVKATEVPMGGYGIFPKADLSEVYIKSWNNNGTTSIITFKPVAVPSAQEPVVSSNDIINKLNELENKLDSIIDKSTKKKEINL